MLDSQSLSCPVFVLRCCFPFKFNNKLIKVFSQISLLRTRGTTVILSLLESLHEIAVVHPQQVGEGGLLNFQKCLLNNFDTACTRALVTHLEFCELWTHSSLDYTPDCFDRTLQLAAVGGDELDLCKLSHDTQPVFTFVS